MGVTQLTNKEIGKSKVSAQRSVLQRRSLLERILDLDLKVDVCESICCNWPFLGGTIETRGRER